VSRGIEERLLVVERKRKILEVRGLPSGPTTTK
jgi:hypothetical protein